MKKLIAFASMIIMWSVPLITNAQCAMCRTQVVNNVSHGETSLAAGLNLGIMYLFFAPYIILGVVGYFWYRNAKVNEPRKGILDRIKRI